MKTAEEMFGKYSKENYLDLEQVRAILPFVKWLDSNASQFRSSPSEVEGVPDDKAIENISITMRDIFGNQYNYRERSFAIEAMKELRTRMLSAMKGNALQFKTWWDEMPTPKKKEMALSITTGDFDSQLFDLFTQSKSQKK